MSTRASQFSAWMESQKDEENGGVNMEEIDQSLSMLGQFSSIQDNFASQMQDLSGSLHDGPLGAAFRQRIQYSIYLFIASVVSGGLAILIGLPVIVLRPAKFVVLTTMATIFASASVIVMQTPTVFFQNVLAGDMQKQLSVAALGGSLLFTLYTAVAVHKYSWIVAAGIIQLFCMLMYLSSFIPGGPQGVIVLLKTGYIMTKTAMKPCIFVTKKFLKAVIRKIFS
jgi:hypothetical protein